jgi:Flp pilus assembly protein TadG
MSTQARTSATAPSSPVRRGSSIARLARDESGQGVVEFALVVPLICAIVLILVDFGKAMNYWLDLTRVASEGARLAAVNSPVTDDSIRARLMSNELRNGGSGSITSPADVTISVGGCNVGDPVTVEVTSEYHWVSLPDWMPLGGDHGFIRIKGKSTMRLEQRPTSLGVGC